MLRNLCALGCLIQICILSFPAAGQDGRQFFGIVATAQHELVPGAVIEIAVGQQRLVTLSDAEGRFSVRVPSGPIVVNVGGKSIASVEHRFGEDADLRNVKLVIRYVVPPVSESVTIQSDALTPTLENRNEAVFRNHLFNRDDQLIHALNAGINAGQHEGGGKSLEIRRYGYNLDHGGVGGGLKILVDNIQQNQGTQGHGQGYLGSLKSVSPELVKDVSIISGPFSAAYGDFSGLGVVHIQLRESLEDRFTARLQAGSFDSVRGFFAYSPEWKNLVGFIAFEPSYANGPFENRLRYRRFNLTGNLGYKSGKSTVLGVKFNGGTNSFFSSGQIPLDLVTSGQLGRFGNLDPDNGGDVRLGTLGLYYRREFDSGAVLRADGFVARSLFDLYSNFTFFAADPLYGDEIQQHDSRLQQGANTQYILPYSFSGGTAVVTLGGNFHANQINVGLYPTINRSPNRKFVPGNLSNSNVLLTSANARVNNYAGYVQNDFAFLDGRLHVDAGLRFDLFTFKLDGFELSDVRTDLAGSGSQGRFQPKLGVAFSPSVRIPLTIYGNYGRGISSQDARGIAREPSSPKVSTTDFFQTGLSYNDRRFSAVFNAFLIDRSSEQIYIPDDGSIEMAGPSRSHGIEARSSIRFSRNLSLYGGFTKVLRAVFDDEFAADGSRLIVDSAPGLVANASLVLSNLKGFNASLSWRHISRYRLDGDDPSILASGHDVVDLAITRRITRWMDASLSIDNLLNKRYYEMQNYFESRTCSTCDLLPRIHATPGYSTTITAGVTFRLGRKQ